MRIQLIRSATVRVSVAGVTLLIDPWLAAEGHGRSSAGARRSPLAPLPVTPASVVAGVDLALVSHPHSDHIDEAAIEALQAEGTPVAAPRHDLGRLAGMGLGDVAATDDRLTVGPVEIELTAGLHGPSAVLDEMGEVSGFLVRAPDEPLLYWAGDTILRDAVRDVIRARRPDIFLVHACGATWRGTGPLVMDAAMVVETLRIAHDAMIVATHMDAVDHATVSRRNLRAAADAVSELAHRLLIPADGEALEFPSPALRG